MQLRREFDLLRFHVGSDDGVLLGLVQAARLLGIDGAVLLRRVGSVGPCSLTLADAAQSYCDLLEQ